MFGLFVRVLERGKFLYNKMAELVAEVEESVVDGCSFDLYTGILSRVENREFVTLRNTQDQKNYLILLKHGLIMS